MPHRLRWGLFTLSQIFHKTSIFDVVFHKDSKARVEKPIAKTAPDNQKKLENGSGIFPPSVEKAHKFIVAKEYAPKAQLYRLELAGAYQFPKGCS
jgi:hypothetical protein